MCGLLCGLLELQISRALAARHERAQPAKGLHHQSTSFDFFLSNFYSARAITAGCVFVLFVLCAVFPLSPLFLIAPRLLHEIVRCQKIAL
jgi:hypothetical protein